MTDETHYPNFSSALLDLHSLLVMFPASESIAGLPQKATIRRLFADIERDEITRILLALAATVRIVDETERSRACQARWTSFSTHHAANSCRMRAT